MYYLLQCGTSSRTCLAGGCLNNTLLTWHGLVWKFEYFDIWTEGIVLTGSIFSHDRPAYWPSLELLFHVYRDLFDLKGFTLQ